jgi:hypothetical protein
MDKKENDYVCSLGEENMVILNKLDIKQKEFEKKMTENTGDLEIFTGIYEDKFHIAKGDAKIDIAIANWHAVARYGMLPTSGKYYWEWDIPKHEKITTALSDISEDLQFMVKNNIITFTEPMIISFLQAFLCEYIPYDYMMKRKIGETDYVVMGLFNTKWCLEVLDPKFDDELSSSLTETI